MTTIDVVIARISGVTRRDLECWISRDWVRPDRRDEGYAFTEIDVARVRLIKELRDDMEINESALPVVLLLLDQVYDLRRQLREFDDAVTKVVPGDLRLKLRQHLAGSSTLPP